MSTALYVPPTGLLDPTGMRVINQGVEEAEPGLPDFAAGQFVDIEFAPYPKTPRLRREVVITEKIDGTNAQIVITPANAFEQIGRNGLVAQVSTPEGLMSIRAGSRNRWITPGKDTDNYGFASWAQRNANDLVTLGIGQHFGEWWGLGIARGYGLGEKVFSLFNTARWGSHNPSTPACCRVVPVLGVVQLDQVQAVLRDLKLNGSRAAPGYFNVEGIIVYHSASKQTFKVLAENDELPKGAVQ